MQRLDVLGREAALAVVLAGGRGEVGRVLLSQRDKAGAGLRKGRELSAHEYTAS
jgi:hypothetical protein